METQEAKKRGFCRGKKKASLNTGPGQEMIKSSVKKKRGEGEG